MLNMNKNIAVGVFFKLFSSVLKFLLIVIITNYFGAENYGIYIFTMTVFLLFNTLMRLGFDTYIFKISSELEKSKKYYKSIIIFTRLILINTVIVIFTTIIIEVILFFLPQNFFPQKVTYLQFMLPISIVYNFVWLSSFFLRGINYINFSIFSLEILFVIINAILILVFDFFNYPPLICLILSFGLTSVTVLLVNINKLKDRFSLIGKVARTKVVKLNFSVINESFPFLLVSLSSLLLGWIDILVLGFLESNENVGIYSIITRIGVFFLVPLSVAGIYYSKIIVVNYNEPKVLVLYFCKITLLIFIPTAILFVLVNIFNSELLSIFGNEFNKGKNALLIYTIAQLIVVLTGLFDSLFVMTNLKLYLVKINLFIIALNILLNIPLVYVWGIEGAAISTLIAILVSKTIQLNILIKKKLLIFRINPENKFT